MSGSGGKGRKRAGEEAEVTRGLKLVKVTESATTKVVELPDSENPFKIEFYKHEDAFLIPPEYKARMAWNSFHSCYFIFLARENSGKSLSVLRWSMFESLGLLDHLVNFLISYDNRPKTGSAAMGLLDVFKGKEQKLYEHEEKNWIKYWKNPDFATDNVSIRWCHRKSTHSYTMILHSPVREEKKLKDWDGPQLWMSIDSVRMLVAFMRHARKQMLYEPTEDKENVPPSADSDDDDSLD